MNQKVISRSEAMSIKKHFSSVFICSVKKRTNLLSELLLIRIKVYLQFATYKLNRQQTWMNKHTSSKPNVKVKFVEPDADMYFL